MSFAPLVLVVEDDGDTRLCLRQLLEAEGYSVEEATNGRDALARLARAPLPGLVLLDLMMPVMNGQTLLLELEARPELEALRIVVMTASAVDQATSTLEVPMLRKPVDPDALLRIVEQYSPQFWSDEEATTETDVMIDLDPRSTARQTCARCGQKAATRCAGCGDAFCPACFVAGSAGVCPRCSRRNGG